MSPMILRVSDAERRGLLRLTASFCTWQYMMNALSGRGMRLSFFCAARLCAWPFDAWCDWLWCAWW